MKNKCGKCNKENPQDAKFCMYCGEKLIKSTVIHIPDSLTKEEIEQISHWIR